jgi:hypothetical protein
VELKDQLSRRDIQTIIDETRRIIDCTEAAPVAQAPEPVASHRRWKLADRLGEEIIQQLLADSRAGMGKPVLMEKYGISRSSVKRILRRGQG